MGFVPEKRSGKAVLDNYNNKQIATWLLYLKVYYYVYIVLQGASGIKGAKGDEGAIGPVGAQGPPGQIMDITNTSGPDPLLGNVSTRTIIHRDNSNE